MKLVRKVYRKLRFNILIKKSLKITLILWLEFRLHLINMTHSRGVYANCKISLRHKEVCAVRRNWVHLVFKLFNYRPRKKKLFKVIP